MDWSKAARRPSERLEIVEAVLNGDPGIAESEYLEWKTDYVLTSVPGRLATARQIIAFANRDPDRAAKQCEGCAYLLLGVEPHKLIGTPVHDPAALEDWLSPYVGAKVAWNPFNVPIQNSQVLFITIEAPRWGDGIHSLQREAQDIHGQSVREGSIWVRKPGKSEQPGSADLDRLTERARAGARTLKLSLSAREPTLKAVAAEVLADRWRDEVLAAERRELLRGVPSGRELFPFYHGEARTVETYHAQVEEYLAQASRRWQAWIVAAFVENEGCPLTFVVRNDSAEVFDSVQVEVRLPFFPSWTYADPGGARRNFKPPQPPPRWGKMLDDLSSSIGHQLAGIGGPEVEEREEDTGSHTLVRFNPILVRPHSTHPLDRLLLALPPSLAGQEIPVSWRATSSSTSGEDKGKLTLTVEDDPSAEAPETTPS